MAAQHPVPNVDLKAAAGAKPHPDPHIDTDISGAWADYLATYGAHHPLDHEARPPIPLPITDLSKDSPARELRGWWLADRSTHTPRFNVQELIGASLFTPKLSTSPIIAIDPQHKRVQTRSGSIYTLGLPDANFAAHARNLLRTLGI